MAVDLDTGELLWAYQATENDVFMGGCNGPDRSAACPDPMGPDADIGNSPILMTSPDGQRMVFGGTKSGEVFAVGGMLFIGSGYGIRSGASAGNVLLAFEID